MNYEILFSGKNTEFVGDHRPLTDSIFFTTDRTIGRNPRLISEALRRLYPSFSAFNGDPKRFGRPHQTHTDRILQVTEAFFSRSEEERKALMEGIDAVVSDVRNVCLGISTADCILDAGQLPDGGSLRPVPVYFLSCAALMSVRFHKDFRGA